MKVKKFKDINEEFIGDIVKGSLNKLFTSFSEPFKDLSNDFKSMFKDNDPNSIKGIIMTIFNKSIDNTIKEIPQISDDSGITDLMSKMIDGLVKLANGLDKDVITALGIEKAKPASAIAKSVILGNKESNWAGIVGLLDPDISKANTGIVVNYKYNKAAYAKSLTDSLTKGAANPLKSKKDAAIKFIGDMQKDMKSQLDNEFTNDKVQKLYNEFQAKGEVNNYKSGDSILYILDGKKDEFSKLTDDQKKNVKIDPAKSLIGSGKIEKIENGKYTILYGDNKRTDKTSDDIIGKSEVKEGDNAKKLHTVLADIKGDEEKMGQVLKFADFIKEPNNKSKIPDIEKIIGGGTI